MWLGLLKSVGLWLLKMLLGNFANSLLQKQLDEQRRKEDALKEQLKSLEQGKDLEIETIKKFQDTENAFKAKGRAADDPLGYKNWNTGGPQL